jgi:hypothetical protein
LRIGFLPETDPSASGDFLKIFSGFETFSLPKRYTDRRERFRHITRYLFALFWNYGLGH